MIKVYFETTHPAYAEQVATFISEEVYDACLPALEALAKKHHFDFVSESVEGEIQLTYPKNNKS